jgi:DNA-binding transcriptional ArsR family regulator
MLEDKLENLIEIIKSLESIVIAFSGGVDSTLLAKVALDVLGDKVIAVTARSETYTKSELEDAIELAKKIGLPVTGIYYHLKELSYEGLIISEKLGRKKVYSLTVKGKSLISILTNSESKKARNWLTPWFLILRRRRSSPGGVARFPRSSAKRRLRCGGSDPAYFQYNTRTVRTLHGKSSGGMLRAIEGGGPGRDRPGTACSCPGCASGGD